MIHGQQNIKKNSVHLLCVQDVWHGFYDLSSKEAVISSENFLAG
jgi:hypothetical protein